MGFIYSLLHPDTVSFFLGLITASLFWYFFRGIRETWPWLKESWKSQAAGFKQLNEFNIEERIRRSTVQQAQAMHLASSLFALDEILVIPKLLAPPHQAEPGAEPREEDVVSRSILYTPDWPQLAAIYGSSTIEVYEPLTVSQYVAICGQPGVGKTTAMAHLASIVARRETPVQVANELIPILVHAADLSLPLAANADPVKQVIDLVVSRTPGQTNSQLVNFLNDAFSSGRVLLLLDGTDELPAANVREISSFLEQIIKRCPQIRVVVTATTEYSDGLTDLGFQIYSLAHWSPIQVDQFATTWTRAWSDLVESLNPNPKHALQPLVLKNWLVSQTVSLSPFDWTLEAWALCSGDILGPQPLRALETYLNKWIEPGIRSFAEQIALRSTVFALPAHTLIELEQVLAEYPARGEQARIPLLSAQPGMDSQGDREPDDKGAQRAARSYPIHILEENGILIRRNGDRYGFAHPLICGYLAAFALQNHPEQAAHLIKQQSCTGKFQALRFLGSLMDTSSIVSPLLADIEEPLYRNLFIVSRWLREASGTPDWKTNAIRSLVELIQSENSPMGIRQRALTALLSSGDPSLPAIFKQLLASSSPTTVQLAALGAGAIREPKLIPDLENLLGSQDLRVVNAASLALVSLGSQPAVEAVTRLLLSGDEPARRAAAESLANHPAEGFPVLQDASVVPDILVRRAAVFGLARVKEKWAVETLEKMRIEDGQWVIRNAASQAVEDNQKPNTSLYRQLPPPAQSPWLVSFAAKQGLGIAGDSPALDMLTRALRQGEEEEKLAALDYLLTRPGPEVMESVFSAAYNDQTRVQNAAINVLFNYAAMGVTLPAPSVYGLGKVLMG